ncbi:MAG: rRNA maturation RNase YbeY [Clostridia bacterium]|nr:rRNA maturation RNase YbeY [Clostridia bacterium]
MKKTVHYHPAGQSLKIDFSAVNVPTNVGYTLKSTVRTAVAATLHHEEFFRDAEVSVTFCDDVHIRTLNAEYRKKDAPTDVLSFPIYEKGEAYSTPDVPVLLGDIVISLERAKEQGEKIGNTLEEEVSFLTVHSTLHLLGYDHETSKEDEDEMFARQKEIVATIRDGSWE